MSYILESIEIETLSNKDGDDNILGSEYFMPSGEKVIAIDTSQDNQITEFCSTELEQKKDSEVFAEGYVVILTNDSMRIVENENNEIENFYTEEHSSADNQSNEKNKKVVVEAEFLCSIEGCNKRFGSAAQLKSHERRHGGVSYHECESCQKRFSTGYALKKHRRIHTGEKPYVCPEVMCQKMFKTSGDFQKHLRTHTGERPFKCGICSKAFTTSNIRTVHMRVHTGEKPYECTYEGCEKKFSSATNFRNHVRIHTGEKPYECLVQNCRKRFTEYSSLYKHYTVHFQKKSYACSICHRRYRQFSTFKYHIKRSSCSQGKSKEDEICLTESDQEFLPPSMYNKDDNSQWTSISFDSLKTINSGSEAVLVLAVPSDTDESSLQISEEKAQ